MFVNRRRIKTWLEVPDDRLCNAITLSGCATRMMYTIFCPATGKVWLINLDDIRSRFALNQIKK